MTEIAGTPSPEAGVLTPVQPAEESFQLGRVLSVSFGHATHDTYTAFLAPLLPLIVDKLAISSTQVGLLLIFMRWPSIFQPILGHVSDRINTRYIFVVAPGLTAIAMSLLGLAPTYTMLALLLVVAGISSAGLHVVGPVIIGKVAGKNLGRGTGLWMVGGNLGRTLGPIIIVTLVGLLTLEGTALIMVVGIAISVVLFFQFKDVPIREQTTAAAGRIEWGRVLRGMAPIMLPIAAILATQALMGIALATFLPLYLSGEGAQLLLAGAALTVFEGAGMAGALLGGSLSDRIGRRAVLALSFVTAPLLMLMFLNTGDWVRFPLLILMGLTSLASTPVLVAIVLENYPQNRGLANGIFMATSFLISSGAGVLLGALADSRGMQTAFTISAVVALLGIPFVLMLPRRGEERAAQASH